MSFINNTSSPRQKLSAQQEGRVIKIILVLLVVAVLWLIFAPGSGVVTLMSKKSKLETLQQETTRLQQQIDQLQQTIQRLQDDPKYLEEVARRDFGLLKKNEKVYDFSKPKPAKEQ